MTHQPKLGPDYSGQNLSGRSFRGQALRGAVFRNADLRGVDFREADLTGANFSGARMGKTWRRKITEFPGHILLALALVSFSYIGMYLMVKSVFRIILNFTGPVYYNEFIEYYFSILPWLGLQITVVILLRKGRLEWIISRIVFFLILACILMVDFKSNFFKFISLNTDYYFLIGERGLSLFILDMTLVIALTFGVICSGVWAGFEVLAIAIGLIFIWTMIVIGMSSNDLFDYDFVNLFFEYHNFFDALNYVYVKIAPIFILVGTALTEGIILTAWLSQQTICHEAPELDWLRRWSLRFRCGGGTDFRGAGLIGADFSNAQLDYARFAEATLDRSHWREAINLHLTNTYDTVLQPKNIRELLTTGHTHNKDFHGKDLHGLDFSGMNLAEADFTDCDLTGTSFKGADLTAAKLTRAVLLGVDLSNARLTGANIGHWNIDKFTQFGGIDCEYVYLDEECKERHPASGQFRPGEFAKLYQEIAHTVDFLIENSTQMEALLRTLEKLRASYDDEDIAQVQKVERKGEAYKVSVAVPAEMEEILRKEIRQEFAQQLLESQSHVKLLQNDHQHLQRERDNLKEMLVLSLSRPINVNATAEANAMNNSRKIEKASITNSAVNLGDHAEVNNTTQIGSQLSEIGPLLEQLRGLIQQSTELPEVLKQDALEKVEILSKAAVKPEAEAKSAAAGALEALKTTAKLATGISSVVLALSKLFGF